LLQKAKQFNLPEEDYAPYLKTRDYDHYQETSGFGLGWQRLTQWLLKLPVIWEASHIPRGHHAPRP
jgi:aspartyl/asparaginyl-tRNA synthetase